MKVKNISFPLYCWIGNKYGFFVYDKWVGIKWGKHFNSGNFYSYFLFLFFGIRRYNNIRRKSK